MANLIPNEVIEEIRKSNDIVEVIEEYVQLKKQGQNYLGLCPFHDEKTPSFSVSSDKQIFKCFGCGKSGNVFGFLMEIESYSFFESVKHLADHGGIKLPDTAVPQARSHLSDEAQQVLQAYDWLTKLYHHILRYGKDGKDGYQYFQNRGITDETAERFKLGYAPRSSGFTAAFLEKKGFVLQPLIKAGLLSARDDGSTADRFGGRIIFPIRNYLGKTVGFAGRTLTDSGPKYVNSSESELFRKSKILFNFDLAKKHIRSTGEVILFEGYMDVISAYQAGIKNTVATMGTSLTETQAKLLKRYVDTVIISYDGDDAGIEASYKAANLLRKAGCEIKVTNLTDGMDPDSFIREFNGQAFFEKVIKTSETYISFYMRYLKRNYNLSLNGDRIQYIEKILQEIAKLTNSIERESYLQELSKAFQISMESLQNEVKTLQIKYGYLQTDEKKVNTFKQVNFVQPKKLYPAFHNAEKYLLSYMLHDPAIAEKIRDALGAAFNIEEHKIIVTHLYAYYEEGNPSDVSMFINRLDDQHLQQMVIDLAMMPINTDIGEKEIKDYIQVIEAQSGSKNDMKLLREQQRLAEQQSDPIAAAEIAVKILELRKKMKQS